MEHNFISWNLENWVTVILMVALGYGVFALVVKLAQNYSGGTKLLPKVG